MTQLKLEKHFQAINQLFLDSLLSPRLCVCPHRSQSAQSHWFNPFCKGNSTVKFPRQKIESFWHRMCIFRNKTLLELPI